MLDEETEVLRSEVLPRAMWQSRDYFRLIFRSSDCQAWSLSVIPGGTSAERTRETRCRSMLYDQVYNWGKPGLLKLYIGFKHLLLPSNLDILSCSVFLSVSELL